MPLVYSKSRLILTGSVALEALASRSLTDATSAVVGFLPNTRGLRVVKNGVVKLKLLIVTGGALGGLRLIGLYTVLIC